MLNKRKLLLSLFVLLLLLSVATLILAQSSANFDFSWKVLGNGGGQSSSTSYQVNGTIGQNFAGPPSSSANYQLQSGFWASGSDQAIFLPVIYGPT